LRRLTPLKGKSLPKQQQFLHLINVSIQYDQRGCRAAQYRVYGYSLLSIYDDERNIKYCASGDLGNHLQHTIIRVPDHRSSFGPTQPTVTVTPKEDHTNTTITAATTTSAAPTSPKSSTASTTVSSTSKPESTPIAHEFVTTEPLSEPPVQFTGTTNEVETSSKPSTAKLSPEMATEFTGPGDEIDTFSTSSGTLPPVTQPFETSLEVGPGEEVERTKRPEDGQQSTLSESSVPTSTDVSETGKRTDEQVGVTTKATSSSRQPAVTESPSERPVQLTGFGDETEVTPNPSTPTTAASTTRTSVRIVGPTDEPGVTSRRTTSPPVVIDEIMKPDHVHPADESVHKTSRKPTTPGSASSPHEGP
uniref:Dumpy n=1 Tax=Haemonchus placei TaxID=6290 RepID=A0A158QRM9_HAEPC